MPSINYIVRFVFFRGFPASGGSGYPLQSPSAISASIPNPYAGLTLPARPLRSQYSCRNTALRLSGFALPQNAEGVNNFLAELPTLVGGANQAEAKAEAATARGVAAPVSNPRAVGAVTPRTAT